MIPISIALVVVAGLGYRGFTVWLAMQRPAAPTSELIAHVANLEVRIRSLEAKAGMTRRPFAVGDEEG